MTIQESIYQELWCMDDLSVQKAIMDSAIPPVLRATGLFILRDYEKVKSLLENSSDISQDDVVYQELKLYFAISKDKNPDLLSYEQKSKDLIDKAPWLVYARMLLGNILEQQKRFKEANRYFQELFESCPNNIVALTGVIRILMRNHEYEQALSILRTKPKSTLEGLNPIKRRHWSLILSTYHLFSYWGEKTILRFLFGLVIFISAFLHPIFWLIPVLFFLLFLGLSVFLFRKDLFAFSLSITSALYVPAFWAFGLLLKQIVRFILFTITGS